MQKRQVVYNMYTMGYLNLMVIFLPLLFLAQAQKELNMWACSELFATKHFLKKYSPKEC
jgi:hypothetical protein